MSSADENMRWERVPADSDCEGEYRMVRTPTTGRDLRLVCMSPDFEGTRVHYNGRTVPCFADGCQECQRHKPRRWRGYLLAQVSGTTERVIFEFPALAGKRLDLFFKEYQTLRGLVLIFSRPSAKPNGKVHVQCNGVCEYAHQIPKTPPIRDVLMRIWGITSSVENLHAGGMTHQEVSQAELHDTDGPARQMPGDDGLVTKPLFKPLPADTVLKISDVMEHLGQSAIANDQAIARVNKRDHARRGRKMGS